MTGRLALLVVLIAAVVAGAAEAQEGQSRLFEFAKYPYAARGYVGSGTSLRPIDADTLRPLRPRGLRIGDAEYGPVAAPDGRQVAFGSEIFGQVRVVDMSRLRLTRVFGVKKKTDWGVDPIGWPSPRLLVVHVFRDTGKYGWLLNSLVLVDPTRGRVVRRVRLGNDVQSGYDPVSRRAIFLSDSRARGIVPARLVVVDKLGKVAETRLKGIRVGTEQRRFGPHSRSAALVVERGRDRALVLGARERVAEVDLARLNVRYHRVPRLDPPARFVGGAPLMKWQGTMNPNSSVSRWARPLWPGTVLVGGGDDVLERRGAYHRSAFVPVRVLDTRRWRARIVGGDYGAAMFTGGRLLLARRRGWTAYDRRLRVRYRLPRPGPAFVAANRLYIGRRDGATTRVYDARTGRLLRRVRPRFVDYVFAWPSG
jgi:hypothetical protein